ncbi:MAG: outer membrane protein assembly factor BamD [Gammaproteobacteria bacterium]|nr:outer membrane protein assembly factor BamD [Gammaproteobacteria bacterium]MCK5091494.1 outer membrane protein assembly factor BamD [Gammaproteobacteria bacterium]
MNIIYKSFFIISAITLLSLSGCSWLPDQIDETKDWSATQIYQKAHSAMKSEDYESAIKYFELLEARYPFGRYAQQAQIEVAYTYYKYDEPDLAMSAADRFIRLHPRHPNVDYMLYLKGIINFHRDSSFMDRFFARDPSSRDPGAARQSFFDFKTLTTRFPESTYSEDAKKRMLYLRNNLAQHEVNVANFNIRRHAYIAAVNRTKYVVENYDRSTAMPEALATMAIAYDYLEMNDLAEDVRRVLKQNYPDYSGQIRAFRKKAWWQIF